MLNDSVAPLGTLIVGVEISENVALIGSPESVEVSEGIGIDTAVDGVGPEGDVD